MYPLTMSTAHVYDRKIYFESHKNVYSLKVIALGIKPFRVAKKLNFDLNTVCYKKMETKTLN